MEHDLYGRQTMAYKVMKTLNSSEREKIRINMVEENEWTNQYKKLYFDSAIENNKEYISIPSGKCLDKLTVQNYNKQ